MGIGQRAGAYRTILTHFSQRYAKLPVIDDSFRVRSPRSEGHALPSHGWNLAMNAVVASSISISTGMLAVQHSQTMTVDCWLCFLSRRLDCSPGKP